MPKKTASARGGASRSRAKTQKNVQLVRPGATVSENETQQEESTVEEEPRTSASAAKAIAASTATVAKTETATSKKSEEEGVTSQAQKTTGETTGATSTGSAAARLAARRQSQAVPKPTAPRNPGLITVEHYAYVRRDLIYILILAVIMFSAIIILHFIPAIGG